jgi:hypothetical protein
MAILTMFLVMDVHHDIFKVIAIDVYSVRIMIYVENVLKVDTQEINIVVVISMYISKHRTNYLVNQQSMSTEKLA